MYNYHLHTNTSEDSNVEVDDYCKRAVELGFKSICITNHHELPSLRKNELYSLTEDKLEKYYQDVLAARKKYPELEIGFGVEIGYVEGEEKQIKELIDSYPFDFVLGSVHHVDGREFFLVFDKLSFEEKQAMVKRYYEIAESSIRCGLFDSIGHLDLFLRVDDFDYSEYEADLIRTLELIREYDLAFEINTAGYRNRMKDCQPTARVLSQFRDLKVTIGSDAHTVKEFEMGIDEGFQALRNAGFKEICTFKDRKAVSQNI